MRSLAPVGLAALAALSAAPSAAQTPIWMLAQSLRERTMTGHPALGVPATLAGSPAEQCRAAIAATERRYATPPHLLAAIARVESGRRDPASGRVDPWPWSIDAEGVDHVYETKAEAVAAVRALQAAGIRSIDTGCMQVNLLYHPDAFGSLEEAFDPARNADYAARFLLRLRAQTGDWGTATAWYHSASPVLGADYQQRVTASLAAEQAGGAPVAPVPPVVAAGVPTGALMLGNHPDSARLILARDGGPGRALAFYRAAPVPIASGVALR